MGLCGCGPCAQIVDACGRDCVLTDLGKGVCAADVFEKATGQPAPSTRGGGDG
eukprot:gene14097-60825_t